MLAADAPKIREPLGLARIEMERVGERSDRFDRRNFPAFRRSDRLHFRLCRDPSLNGKFVPFIGEKANDIAAAGPNLPAERFDVPKGEGLEPPMALAEHVGRPRHYAFDTWVPGQKSPCERMQKGRVRHKRSAAEMLQRVPLCVRVLREAQSNSRHEISAIHDPPGYPRRGFLQTGLEHFRRRGE